ncbi:hypothetical protein L6452_08057 [Arctium lappa]|uniref:Uncharacterized protein n=1 Tax=Arctium lappa TaxID=4217 RepID=A0ACB9DG85_ARCLA|nr:hypothetical protein L6452_08057 [Arctium lappa]
MNDGKEKVFCFADHRLTTSRCRVSIHRPPIDLIQAIHLVLGCPCISTPMGSCKNCKSKSLITNTVTGNLECSSCGVVQDFDNYEQQTFNADGPIGTNVRLGTSGSWYDYSYRETKIYLAQKIVSDILLKLDLENRVDEVNNMIKIITEEEYGSGNWFNVLVGACIYVVMRKANKDFLASMYDQVVCDDRRVVPVIVFVCELNEVEVSLEDLASQLNVAAGTCKLRYKEILKRLVDVARVHLPWGNDVFVKNIMKNAPIVI